MSSAAAVADVAAGAPGERLSKRQRAQLGNLNRARHPWRSFWRRRALQREDRWIQPLLEDYAQGLISDKGGPDAMSAAELRMVELAQLAGSACSRRPHRASSRRSPAFVRP